MNNRTAFYAQKDVWCTECRRLIEFGWGESHYAFGLDAVGTKVTTNLCEKCAETEGIGLHLDNRMKYFLVDSAIKKRDREAVLIIIVTLVCCATIFFIYLFVTAVW